MPTPRLVTIQAWSYSRYQEYDQCPLKAKLKCIDKLKEPDSPSGNNGTRVHAIAASWATNRVCVDDQTEHLRKEIEVLLKTKKVPEDLKTFEKEFAALRARKDIIVEDQWAFNRSWDKTSWFNWKECWLRIKVDLHYVEQIKRPKFKTLTRVVIRDHKTGKIHSDHDLQRSLYALGAFLTYPDVDEVEVSHWYLDAGEESPKQVFKRKQFETLKKFWLKKTTAMLNDTTFAPKAGGYCRWCHFSKAKGGPCPF